MMHKCLRRCCAAAVGCEVLTQPAILKDMGIGARSPHQSYTFTCPCAKHAHKQGKARADHCIAPSGKMFAALAGFNDLRNFTFLGPSGRLGMACDWVWFNVPQGPQKQIACFLHAYRAWRDGKGQARPDCCHHLQDMQLV